jgi:hypothetical protein
MLHDTYMKNKAHCTLLETQPQSTHQTGVEGRKYIFSSMQYIVWHSSCQRMKYFCNPGDKRLTLMVVPLKVIACFRTDRMYVTSGIYLQHENKQVSVIHKIYQQLII